jgi:outer membrane protein assembly factor BamB
MMRLFAGSNFGDFRVNLVSSDKWLAVDTGSLIIVLEANTGREVFHQCHPKRPSLMSWSRHGFIKVVGNAIESIPFGSDAGWARVLDDFDEKASGDGLTCNDAIYGERLFLVRLSGIAQVLTATSGHEAWHARLRGSMTCPTFLGNTVVLVANGPKDSDISAFDVQTGRQTWTRVLHDPLVRAAAAAGRLAISTDDVVTYLDPRTGGTQESKRVDGTILNIAGTKSGMILLVRNWRGQRGQTGLAVLDRGSKVVLERPKPAGAQFVVGDDVLVFEERHEKPPSTSVSAWSISDGQRLWAHEEDGVVYGLHLASHGRVFLGDGGIILALDLKSGRKLWKHTVAGPQSSSDCPAAGE